MNTQEVFSYAVAKNTQTNGRRNAGSEHGAVCGSPAVTAAYICDVSQGSVNITVDADGSKTIQVGGQKVEDDGDGTDDIIITGDNTQAPASQNDAADPAPAETEDEEAPAEEDAAPADEAEAPETADAEGTEDAAADDADAEDAAAEPATLELSAPAVDTGDEAEDTPAEPERTVTETEDGTVIEYGDYTVDPDVQVTKPEPAPEAAAPAEKAADPEDETVTYEARPRRTRRSSARWWRTWSRSSTIVPTR